MKKKILAILCVLSIVSMAGCNYQVFDLNYNFTNAYVKVGDVWIDLELKMWTDYDGEQIQLTLKDGTVMVVSSVNCVLYNGKLPKEME